MESKNLITMELHHSHQSFPSSKFRVPIPSLILKAGLLRDRVRFRDYQGLKFESETETSPKPRDSVFRVRVSLLQYKSWSKNVQILWFLTSLSKFRFRVRFRVLDDLKIEADSETETSPEPRVSMFRVRDERLGKFWSVVKIYGALQLLPIA